MLTPKSVKCDASGNNLRYTVCVLYTITLYRLVKAEDDKNMLKHCLGKINLFKKEHFGMKLENFNMTNQHLVMLRLMVGLRFIKLLKSITLRQLSPG